MRWVNAWYLPTIERGGVVCDCGRFIPLSLHLPVSESTSQGIAPERYRQIRGMHLHCPVCNGTNTMQLTNLALYLPLPWRFWSEHGRIRTLPQQEIEFQARPALLLPFQAVTSAAQIDVIVARDTYAILAVQPGTSAYQVIRTPASEEIPS